MGYHRAGFEVVGVDVKPQPRYPFTFIQADAVEILKDDSCWQCLGIWPVDAIHASPPCQAKSKMTNCRPGLAGEYPDLIEPVCKRLTAWGGPWIIENVDGAGLPGQDDLFGAHGVMLCGAMFGRALYRHRWFQGSFPLHAPNHPRHLRPASRAGHWRPGTVISVEGNCSPVALARQVMEVSWTTRDELAESIPPYFTEYIGRQLIDRLNAREAA